MLSRHLNNEYYERRQFRSRMVAMAIFVSLLSSLLIARLTYLDVSQYQRFSTLSKKNQLNIAPIAPTRGLIYERNGKLLAENVVVHNLEIIVEKVNNLNRTLDDLQRLLPEISQRDRDNFLKVLKQHRVFEPVALKMKLGKRSIARFSVEKYHFPGVEVKARLMRHYPLNSSLSHVLGFVGRINEREQQFIDAANYRSTNYIGKVGVEKYYERLLHGTVGYQQVETDASGRTLRVMAEKKALAGEHLYLTIDSQLQQQAEKALGNEQGSIVAIDPNNGEILALVSNPHYDANLFVNGISNTDYKNLSTSKQQPLFNRAVRGQYPLASTIKPFLALAALSKGVITKAHRIYDPGWFKLANAAHIYRDWKRFGHGWINLQRAIIVSCDTYFYQLAERMGIRQIDDILFQFGFGRLTHIDIGEELPGLIPSPQWKQNNKHTAWYTGDTLISGIGQGFMLATPLQLANATAALAMRGKHFRPHLLLKQYNPNTSKQITYKPIEQYPIHLKSSAWTTIIDAMSQVLLSREGTGFRFGRNAPYSVAIKTGTAQVYSIKNREIRHYDELPKHLRDHSLFIGFAPIKHPKIALAIVVENANLATVIARRLMDNYLLRDIHAYHKPERH